MASPTASCCPHSSWGCSSSHSAAEPHQSSGTAPQRSPSTAAGISVLAKPWHIPQRFHGYPNTGGTSPLKGAAPTKPNHRHPRATQRAKPCPSVRPASLTAAVPRAGTCLWFPSSPPGSASHRPDPMQDGAVRLKGCSLQLCPALPGDSQLGPRGDGPWWVWYSRSSSGAAECPGQGRARRAAGSGVTQQISPQSTHFSVPTTIPPDFRMDRTRR